MKIQFGPAKVRKGPWTKNRNTIQSGSSSPDSDEVAVHSRCTISGNKASTAGEAEGVVPYTLESGRDDGNQPP
jgi:hypothetical protein